MAEEQKETIFGEVTDRGVIDFKKLEPNVKFAFPNLVRTYHSSKEGSRMGMKTCIIKKDDALYEFTGNPDGTFTYNPEP